MKQPAIAFDQFANTLVWAKADAGRGFWSGFGRADETLSARAYRLHDKSALWGRFRSALDVAFRLLGDPDHCRASWVAEYERRHLPLSYSLTPVVMGSSPHESQTPT